MITSQRNPQKTGNQNENNVTRYEQQILDTSSIGVLITRMSDGTILYANKAIGGLLGIPDVDSVIGSPVPNFYWDPEERQLILQRFRVEGSISQYPLRARRPDNSMVWVSISIQSFNYEGEQVILSEIVDISERKQVEETLAREQSLMRVLMDSTPDKIYFKDLQSRFLRSSKTLSKMFGVSDPSDIVGKSDSDFFTKEHAQLAYEDEQTIIRTGQPISKEERETWSDRPDTWALTTKFPLYDEAGKLVGTFGISRDITESKQAEAQLSESEARYHLLSEASTEGIAIHEKGVVLDVNQACSTMFGYELAEFIGMSATDFFAPESREVVAQNIRAGYEKPYEVVGLRKDGATFPIELVGKAIPYQGRMVRVTVLRDLTERKQAEQELQESKQILQLVMDNIPQAVFWKDKESLKYLGVNQAFAEDAGFASPQELIGKNDFDMPWKEQAELYRADDQKVLELGEPKLNYEEPQTGPTGQVTWLRTSKIPMRDIDGKMFAVLGMYEDITEQKRLQQEVQAAFERRGYQVQVGTEISQEVAAASEVGDLFDRVVTLTKERLGYYHTQLLRYDPAQDAVVLINGYGETGKRMLADGHKMPMGSGLIGAAAATGETVMRPTLAEDLTWRPNPLLPETKGEIAVPIKWQDKVLGVLDVQSDKAGALAEDDRLLLEGLCGQIAIAMRSAELVETIRENEARLADALKAARLGNWEYDFEHDLFEFSDDFYSIFRTTAEKVGGYKISSADYAKNFVHPDDAPLVGTEIQKALDAKDRLFTTHLEHRIIFADGEVGYIAVNINVERDENGKITRWYGANQDITERKQAELALQESQTRLTEALRMAKLAYWEHNLATNQFQLNDQYYAVCHTTAEQEGGYTMSPERLLERFTHPEDRSRVGQAIAAGMQSTERHYRSRPDYRLIATDGSDLGYMAIETNIERDEQGNIIRVHGSLQDVTERKLAEEALRINETRLNEALQIAGLAHWEYDVEKDIFTFNDQFYSLFHTTAEQHGGYQLSSAYYAQHFVYPDDLPIVGVEIEKALNSTGRHYSRTLEHRVLYADGGVGHISVNINVDHDENGKITRYYGANQDITERVRQQQELAERLEEINRLYQNLSHEGWKNYRETEDLPAGFMFDQAGIKPLEDKVLEDDQFSSVPMKILGGEVVGTLAIADDPQNPASPEDRAFLQQVSEQVALALESARLAAQTESERAQSERLFEASRVLSQSANLQELVTTTIKMIDIPEINRALLATFSYDAEDNIDSLDIRANWWNGTGHEVTAVGTHYPFDVIRTMSFFVSPTPVFFNDTHVDERVDATTMKLVKSLNLRSVAVLPLYTGTQQIGALILEGEEPYGFTQEETRLFTALAPQISTMLENRRQFERAQQQAERETTLNIISQKIQSATTVEAVLQIAARELGHALGAPMTIAQLNMKDKK